MRKLIILILFLTMSLFISCENDKKNDSKSDLDVNLVDDEDVVVENDDSVDSDLINLDEDSSPDEDIEYDKKWHGAHFISELNKRSSFPEMAFDSKGDAVAVWEQEGSSGSEIWSNRYYSEIKEWGNPQLIAKEKGDAIKPKIEIGGYDSAIVIWKQSGEESNVWANKYSLKDNSWAVAEQLIVYDDTPTKDPQISFSSDGDAIAIWEQHYFSGGSDVPIITNRYSRESDSWIGAKMITDEDIIGAEPQIIFDSKGNATAIWLEKIEENLRRIYSRRYSLQSGKWGEIVAIEDGVGYTFRPKIGVDSNDDLIVIWEELNGLERSVWSTRYSFKDGTWGDDELLDIGGESQYRPEIIVCSNNDVVAVWVKSFDEREMAPQYTFSIRYSSKTGSWGEPEMIDIEDGSYSLSPQIAFDSVGNGFAVWGKVYESGYTYIEDVWINSFNSQNGNWGNPEMMEIDNGGASPQIAFDNNDNAIVLWYAVNMFGRYTIFANEYY